MTSVTGGRNGYGAKLTNIFSKRFVVETSDHTNGRRFKQVFRNNMSVKDEPVIGASDPKVCAVLTGVGWPGLRVCGGLWASRGLHVVRIAS